MAKERPANMKSCKETTVTKKKKKKARSYMGRDKTTEIDKS